MRNRELSKKPLIEALVEIKWKHKEYNPNIGQLIDPSYQLLLGLFYSKIKDIFPFHESLPISESKIPLELLPPQVVHHRFRVGKNNWPLVQLGPGILSVNSTSDYSWDLFKPNCENTIKQLIEVHPGFNDLSIDRIVLQYIDAFEYDFFENNILEYLADKLKINITLANKKNEERLSHYKPVLFNQSIAYSLSDPVGQISLRIASGERLGKRAIIMETMVSSEPPNVPNLDSSFSRWLESAHSAVNNWFFELIEGDLYERHK